MKIYAAKVCKIPNVINNGFLTLLDSRRLEKVNAIKRESEREESICAGLLLRRAFLNNGYNNNTWHHIKITEGSYGKPYADVENFFYSISHSGEWVICAVDDMEIGADIQEMKVSHRTFDKMALARRFYSEGEYKRLLEYDNDKTAAAKTMQAAEFYRMWTAKESCVKLTGRGIGAGIERYAADSLYTYVTDAESGEKFFIRLYESIPRCMVCVCSRRRNFADSIIEIDIAGDIFNME